MSTRAITAISDFSSSLGMSAHLSKLPGTSQETVRLESGGEALVLYGVPVFRSGTFRDSMGDENTWTDTHIAEMVSHFQQLSATGAFDRVPVRCDHYSIFSGGLSNVIGYHDKPVGFLDAGGFWAPLLGAIRGIGDAGFLRQTAIEDLVVAPSLDEALAGLDAKLPSERELRPGT